ncbi:hypothetical protein L914_16851 [Phytophthora nicotianae]|uniref:SWIM-type domain-containing protein n=1 Tax=Phytophthora nicotianae TaxID=4792 RepID=W2MLC9_PHYNI|nr:hypothetical protein L914_16851 [Phytophthora nicotianae]
MHRAQMRDRTINIDHDIAQPVWTRQEALLVRSKYLCTCRSYFVTGWVCSHIVATMTLIDDFPLSVMMQALPARKPPGRPRKGSRALARDGNSTAFFDVDNMIALLLAKPSRLLNFPVLIENPSSHENIPGVVSTWKNQRGVYKWNVLLSGGSIDISSVKRLLKPFALQTKQE